MGGVRGGPRGDPGPARWASEADRSHFSLPSSPAMSSGTAHFLFYSSFKVISELEPALVSGGGVATGSRGCGAGERWAAGAWPPWSWGPGVLLTQVRSERCPGSFNTQSRHAAETSEEDAVIFVYIALLLV